MIPFQHASRRGLNACFAACSKAGKPHCSLIAGAERVASAALTSTSPPDGNPLLALPEADLAANGGDRRWAAGTGTDAAPNSRIFNPLLQGQEFDDEGTNAGCWVLELRNVPTAYIHVPPKLPESKLKPRAARIDKDYPAALVDLNAARQRVLEAYGEAREKAIA